MNTTDAHGGQGLVILMADDDPDDVALVEGALADDSVQSDFRSVRDGYELIQYLHRRGPYAFAEPDPETLTWHHRDEPDHDPAPNPALILLDLNMPLRNGTEVLAELKSTPHLCKIPIIILTTSDAERDRSRTSRLGANGFMTKPSTHAGLIELRHELHALLSAQGRRCAN